MAVAAASLALLTTQALANPAIRSNPTGSPCASVSALVAAQTTTTASATPTVPADLAYECLNSIPLNSSAALRLVDTIRPYVEWQSTLAFLKDPPAEYVEKVQAPVDILGGLDDISARLRNGIFQGEYEFGWSLYRLIQSAYDGHFVYIPDSVADIFTFGRSVPLVSVSIDGVSLPQPYVYSDIVQSVGNASFAPSPIVQIDGQNATSWLENWSLCGALQDRDALYNSLFYEPAIIALGGGTGSFTGGGRGKLVYPGATTELTFANGTKYTMQNYASVHVSFDGISSGKDIYDKHFTLPKDLSFYNGELPVTVTATYTPVLSTATSAPSKASTGTAASISASAKPAHGYPSPIIRHENNLIGGYYLNGNASDVAVLTVSSFVGAAKYERSFKEVAQKFLRAAREAGKTKLIIDLCGNGGGTVEQGYDLFKQLFPQIDAYAAADRTRAIEAVDLLGQRFSEIAGTVPRTLDVHGNESLLALESDIVQDILNFRTDMRPNGTAFSSWAEKYGPHTFNGDKFTSPRRWNLSDVLLPLDSMGIWVTGYGPEANTSQMKQPFEAENMVVMTEGFCSSTCTIFSRLLTDLAGVKHVAMGGRSRHGGMQAIGGTKGTNDWSWQSIQHWVALAYSYSDAATKRIYNATSLARYNDRTPFLRMAKKSVCIFNYRDAVRADDEEGVPLQFVWEEADWRVFWTKEMVVDVSETWRAVAGVVWGMDE